MDLLEKVKPSDVTWTTLYDRMEVRGTFEIDGQKYECELDYTSSLTQLELLKLEAIRNAKPIWEDEFTTPDWSKLIIGGGGGSGGVGGSGGNGIGGTGGFYYGSGGGGTITITPGTTFTTSSITVDLATS